MAYSRGSVVVLAACFMLHSCISSRHPAGIATTDQNTAALSIYTDDGEERSGLVLNTVGSGLQLEVNLPEAGTFLLKYDLFDYDGIFLFSGEEWTVSGSVVKLSIKPTQLDRGSYLLRSIANSRASFHTIVVE